LQQQQVSVCNVSECSSEQQMCSSRLHISDAESYNKHEQLHARWRLHVTAHLGAVLFFEL
jgi:hypothetical protein